MRKHSRNKGSPWEPTYFPYAASFLLPIGSLLVCIPDSQAAFNIRVAYGCFSLAYGKDVLPAKSLFVFLNPPFIDIVSFLALIRFSYSTCGRSSTWPTILRKVVKDSALYFLAILGAHLVAALIIAVTLAVGPKAMNEEVRI